MHSRDSRTVSLQDRPWVRQTSSGFPNQSLSAPTKTGAQKGSCNLIRAPFCCWGVLQRNTSNKSWKRALEKEQDVQLWNRPAPAHPSQANKQPSKPSPRQKSHPTQSAQPGALLFIRSGWLLSWSVPSKPTTGVPAEMARSNSIPCFDDDPFHV